MSVMKLTAIYLILLLMLYGILIFTELPAADYEEKINDGEVESNSVANEAAKTPNLGSLGRYFIQVNSGEGEVKTELEVEGIDQGAVKAWISRSKRDTFDKKGEGKSRKKNRERESTASWMQEMAYNLFDEDYQFEMITGRRKRPHLKKPKIEWIEIETTVDYDGIVAIEEEGQTRATWTRKRARKIFRDEKTTADRKEGRAEIGRAGTEKTQTGKTGTMTTRTGQTGTGETETKGTVTVGTGTGKTETMTTITGKTGTGKSGTEKTVTKGTGTGGTGTEKTGTKETVTGKTGTEKIGTKGTVTGKTGTEETVTGKTGTEDTVTGKTGTGKTGTEKTGKTGTEETGTAKTVPGKIGTVKTGTEMQPSSKRNLNICINCINCINCNNYLAGFRQETTTKAKETGTTTPNPSTK